MKPRRYESPGPKTLFLISFLCGTSQSFVSPVGRCRVDCTKRFSFQSGDLLDGIDGSQLKREERELEIRQKVEKLKLLKQQGMRYDESQSTEDDDANDKIEKFTSAGLAGSMSEAESFFSNADSSAVERRAVEEKGETKSTGSNDPTQAALAGITSDLAGVVRTSSIGGAWSPKEKETAEEYKPSTSGSWGVFERPKDISKAFGGGKKIGVGGYRSDPEAAAKKDKESAELLKKFNKLLGPEAALEAQNVERIKAAQAEARGLMARGFATDAVEKLKEVKPVMSFASPFGGSVLIELGMAYEAVIPPEREKAVQIYKKLAVASGDDIVRKQAKQLLYGFTAQEFMKYETVTASSAYGKDTNIISDKAWSGQYYDNSYDTSYIGPTSRRRLQTLKREVQLKDLIKDFKEAREILMKTVAAGDKRSLFNSNRKVKQALDRMYQERGGSSGAAAASEEDDIENVQGTWKLVLSANGRQICYSDPATRVVTRQYDALATQRLLGLQISLPLNGYLNCSGEYEMDRTTWQLVARVQEPWFGGIVEQLFPVERTQVLTVDRSLLVTMDLKGADAMEDRRFEVWVRE